MDRRIVLKAGAAIVGAALWPRRAWAKAPCWLHPLASTRSGSATADIAPLLPLFRGRKVIGLGEATHGSREIFEVKTRLVDALARAGMIGTVAMELGFADGRSLDHYVTGRSDADPRALLAAIRTFSVANGEVLALLQRLRDLNRQRRGKATIRIVGYDIQMPGREAALVIGWLAANGLTDHIALGDTIRDLAAHRDKAIQGYPPASAAAVQRDVAQLAAALTDHSAMLTARTSAEDVADMRHAVAVIGQAFDLFAAPSMEAAYDQRDASGADNIAELQRRDGRGVAVWAHNGHVNKGSYEFAGAKLLGGRLADRLGAGYYAVATAFFAGDVRAAHGKEGVIVNHLPPARAGSLDAFLDAQGQPLFFADLHAARADPRWREAIDASSVLRGVGGGYEPENDQRTYRPTRLAEQFDAVIFVRSVGASTLLGKADPLNRPA